LVLDSLIATMAPCRRNRGNLLSFGALCGLAYYAHNAGTSIKACMEPIICGDTTGEEAAEAPVAAVQHEHHHAPAAPVSTTNKVIVSCILIAVAVAGQMRSSRLAKRAMSKGHGHDHHEEGWLQHLNHTLEGGLGSGILGACALLSMVLANLDSTSDAWMSIWGIHVGPALGGHSLTIKAWVNEGLMALFFFNVGLEIKAELIEGALSSPSKAALPCIAAAGGMVVPMGVYYVINKMFVGGSMDGLTVPMATDIAFAMGVFSLFKRSMPASSSPFLLALATADDLGAIAVIAIVFAGTINWTMLGLAVLTLIAAAIIGKIGIDGSAWFFAVFGVALWYFMLVGGVNADVAGVLVALCVPMHCSKNYEVVHRLVERWTPVCTVLILPVFALANCAVNLSGGDSGESKEGALTVPTGIAIGLMIGKPVGIFSFTWIACKMGLAHMPKGMKNTHLLAVGMLGSIGFTMCLFLIECSLSGQTASMSKLFVLLASVASAAVSGGFMSMLPATHEETEKPAAKTSISLGVDKLDTMLGIN